MSPKKARTIEAAAQRDGRFVEPRLLARGPGYVGPVKMTDTVQVENLVCPSCRASLQMVSKTFHDVESSTGMMRSAAVGTRYDLICTNGHALGGDYSYSPTPETIAEAVEAARRAQSRLVEVPTFG